MINGWTEWKPFPDPYCGDFIAAPLGPGVYEVCNAATREQVAFGCTNNILEALSKALKPGKVRLSSLFRRRRYMPDEFEYRIWATGSLADAKVVIARVQGQRQAVMRQFSPAARY